VRSQPKTQAAAWRGPEVIARRLREKAELIVTGGMVEPFVEARATKQPVAKPAQGWQSVQ